MIKVRVCSIYRWQRWSTNEVDRLGEIGSACGWRLVGSWIGDHRFTDRQCANRQRPTWKSGPIYFGKFQVKRFKSLGHFWNGHLCDEHSPPELQDWEERVGERVVLNDLQRKVKWVDHEMAVERCGEMVREKVLERHSRAASRTDWNRSGESNWCRERTIRAAVGCVSKDAEEIVFWTSLKRGLKSRN